MLHQNHSFSGNATGLKAGFNGRILPALLIAGTAALLQGAGVAHAASPLPYNTGMNVAGMIGMENLDPLYSVSYESGTGSAGDPGTPLTSSNTYVTDLTGLPYSPGDNATSEFISPFASYAAGQSNLGGIYDFTTTFDLTGVNLSTYSLFGRFESDDRIQDILLNGTSLGIYLTDPNYYGFSNYLNLVPSSSDLVQGVNTLTFKLYNFPTGSSTDPVSLRTEFSAVPEPSVWTGIVSLLALGFVGRWLSRRRAIATV